MTLTALVADDYEDSAWAHGDAMTAAGFNTTTITGRYCGETVERHLFTYPHDFTVLVLDNHMKRGPTGVQIVLRMIEQGDRTPVVLCSCNDREDLEGFFEEGFPDWVKFCPKGDPEALVEVVTSLLEEVAREV